MNILLIDDEEFVLDYVEECMEEMSLKIDHIFKALSVDDACQVLDKHTISIIITDICMPEKSGLDLLEIINEHHPLVKSILLSGHSEFEFAKTAIKRGAEDYLLKPVMPDELEEVLQKVIDNLMDEQQRDHEIAKAQTSYQIGVAKAKEHLLFDLMHGRKYTPRDLEKQLADLQINLVSDEPCIIATFLLKASQIDKHQQFENADLFVVIVQNMMEELFYGNISSRPRLWSCKDYYNSINMIIPLDIVQHQFEAIIEKLTLVKETVKEILQLDVSVLVSKPFPFTVDLHAHYTEVLNYSLRIAKHNKNTVHIIDHQPYAANYRTLHIFNEAPTLLHLMESNRWGEMTDKVDAVLAELAATDYSHQQLIEILYYLYSCFSYIAHKFQKELPKLMNDLPIIQNPFNIHSIEQIKDWTKVCIEHFQQTTDSAVSEKHILISQINAFIEQNLSHNVTLNKIGEHVYLHPVYLSRMYKKETGESISSYILRARMEKAVTLLTTTNMKIADISLAIGYQKTQYFIRIFKEYYKTTPQKYRTGNHIPEAK